jgi:hypothetical protein
MFLHGDGDASCAAIRQGAGSPTPFSTPGLDIDPDMPMSVPVIGMMMENMAGWVEVVEVCMRGTLTLTQLRLSTRPVSAIVV